MSAVLLLGSIGPDLDIAGHGEVGTGVLLSIVSVGLLAGVELSTRLGKLAALAVAVR